WRYPLRDHFVARPFALDVVPDVGVRSCGINVDHADLTVAQFFAHALRETFERELAHAISAPVRESSLRRNGKNVDDARTGRSTVNVHFSRLVVAGVSPASLCCCS